MPTLHDCARRLSSYLQHVERSAPHLRHDASALDALCRPIVGGPGSIHEAPHGKVSEVVDAAADELAAFGSTDRRVNELVAAAREFAHHVRTRAESADPQL
ncbi:MAG TPA: hypothetical protein VGI39_22430 [Polyangiaceae bacterium]